MSKGVRQSVYFDRATKERIDTRARNDGMTFSQEVNHLCLKALAGDADQEYLPLMRQMLREREDDLVRRIQGKVDIATEVAADRVIDFQVTAMQQASSEQEAG